MPILEIESLSYTFDPKAMGAVCNFSASLAAPGIISLVGPSGSGKTTFLRLLGGQLTAMGGQVRSPSPPLLLEMPSAASDQKLLSYLSYPEDLAQVVDHLRELLALFDLEVHSHKALRELSQGELKRVYLVKSLFARSPILLLDEPCSGLEPRLVFKALRILKERARDQGRLVVMATHHISEAMALSDEILVMRDGELVQQGSARDIYRYPRNAFVAELLGPTNIIAGNIVEADDQYALVETPLGRLSCQNHLGYRRLHQAVLCHFRPEHLAQVIGSTPLVCRIKDIHLGGASSLYQLSCGEQTCYSSQIAAEDASLGMEIYCEFASGQGTLLDDLGAPL